MKLTYFGSRTQVQPIARVSGRILTKWNNLPNIFCTNWNTTFEVQVSVHLERTLGLLSQFPTCHGSSKVNIIIIIFLGWS